MDNVAVPLVTEVIEYPHAIPYIVVPDKPVPLAFLGIPYASR